MGKHAQDDFEDILSKSEIDLMFYYSEESFKKMGITKKILTDILEGKIDGFEISLKTVKHVKIILMNGKTFPIISIKPTDKFFLKQ